jgi:GNAT superfamily N-acetyltransferase
MGVRRPWKQGRESEGWIKFLWAEPGGHFLSAATSILETLEAELWNRDVRKITFGSSSPSYLLPGVPIGESELLAVLIEAGWRVCSERLNLTLQISPERVGSVESALTDATSRVCTLSSAVSSDRAQIDRFIVRHFSESWRREVEPVFEDRSEAFLSAARGRDGEVVGFAATSATNPCWLGPMGVAPNLRRRGIGRLLVLDSIRQASHRGMKRLLLPWINTENRRFYERVCGAELHQRFWKVEKVRLDPGQCFRHRL